MKIRILKLGWEFPPNHQGGLGVACQGLVEGLINNDVDVTLVLPYQVESSDHRVKVISPFNGFKKIKIDSSLLEYSNSHDYIKSERNEPSKKVRLYGKTIFEEIQRFALACSSLAVSEQFDAIHAHDWMTFKAGMLIKKISGKPLVVHVHSTELDRTGNNDVHQYVYDIEREALHLADKVIAVSNFTKNKIIKHYNVAAHKIHVLYNAVSFSKIDDYDDHKIKNPMVLFLGRLTIQKGPDYFVEVAQKVLLYRDDVDFVVAGSGDMEPRLINSVAEANLSDKIFFTGFLRGNDINKIYKRANMYVMPSVCEPFGIAALEAMRSNTPLIVSKEAGVSETINHCLKVDYWDTNKMAQHILSLLEHPELQNEMADNGLHESQKFNWDSVGKRCHQIYQSMGI